MLLHSLGKETSEESSKKVGHDRNPAEPNPSLLLLLFGSVLSAVGSTVFWGNETTASRFVLSGTSSVYSINIKLSNIKLNSVNVLV